MRIDKAMGFMAASFAISLLACAQSDAAALELHVKRSVTLPAPADKVWDTVKNFDALASWLPPIARDEILSGTNNTPGAVRLLTLKAGGTIKEKLLEFDATGHRYRYSILEGDIPVSHYVSTLTVTSLANDKTLVTWSSHFKRKNLGDNPPDNESDKAATDTITTVYQAGLDNLKKIIAAK